MPVTCPPVKMVALFPDIGAEAAWGQIFMQAVLYGYILSIGADMIGDGAELLMLCPSIAPLVGSIVVPILGAVPDGMMVLCSSLGDDAQEQISVGVGALAGSTVMLLTLPWMLSLVCGRVSIINGECNYKASGDAKLLPAHQSWYSPSSIFGSGVAVHDNVKSNAKIMFMTTIPFWVIQVPAFVVDKPKISDAVQKNYEQPFAVVGAVLCACFFAFYMIKMFRDASQEGSDMQNKVVKAAVEGIQNGHMTLRGAMHDFREQMLKDMDKIDKKGGANLEAPLVVGNGQKAEETVRHMCDILKPFFKKYDQNGDNQVSINEFKLLMSDLRENVSDEKTNKIFNAADQDKSGDINFEEFVACIMAFALDPHQDLNEKEGAELGDEDADGDGDDDDEEEDMPPDLADLSPAEQQAAIKKRACYGMFFGSVLVLLFSDPMCDLLGVMGTKAEIPPFYISFLIAPLASNASELVSAMKLAKKKTRDSMKESLSTLCGAAIMNNTFCLCIFFMCFVMKDLVWKFSAETISIVAIQYVIGIIALVKSTQRLFDGFLILCCYPAAMGIVWALKNFAGMD